MIDASLDESGIHDGAVVCVIAGYFGGPGQWKKFENDWNGLLQDFHVPMEEFHAKDIFPKAQGFFHPINWHGDIQAFQRAIADTIAQQPRIHPVSAGIIVSDFNSFSLDERRYMTGATHRDGRLVSSGCPSKPYFVPFQHVVRQICDYAPVGSKANFAFGLDRQFYGYATDLFEQIEASDLRSDQHGPWGWKARLGTPSYPLAKKTPALQAADFLAALTYHHMVDAGAQLGIVSPSPLLARCLKNYRSREDFYFSTKDKLQTALDNRVELEQYLATLSRPCEPSVSGQSSE